MGSAWVMMSSRLLRQHAGPGRWGLVCAGVGTQATRRVCLPIRRSSWDNKQDHAIGGGPRLASETEVRKGEAGGRAGGSCRRIQEGGVDKNAKRLQLWSESRRRRWTMTAFARTGDGVQNSLVEVAVLRTGPCRGSGEGSTEQTADGGGGMFAQGSKERAGRRAAVREGTELDLFLKEPVSQDLRIGGWGGSWGDGGVQYTRTGSCYGCKVWSHRTRSVYRWCLFRCCGWQAWLGCNIRGGCWGQCRPMARRRGTRSDEEEGGGYRVGCEEAESFQTSLNHIQRRRRALAEGGEKGVQAEGGVVLLFALQTSKRTEGGLNGTRDTGRKDDLGDDRVDGTGHAWTTRERETKEEEAPLGPRRTSQRRSWCGRARPPVCGRVSRAGHPSHPILSHPVPSHPVQCPPRQGEIEPKVKRPREGRTGGR